MIPASPKAAAVVAVALLAVLSGCSGDSDPAASRPSSSGGTSPAASGASSADACADVPDLLVGAVQRYVDGYGTAVSGSDSAASSPDPAQGDTELRNALTQTRDEIDRRGCDPATFREDLKRALAGVTAAGPLAGAVLLRLEASLTGEIGTTAETRTVRPGEDLSRALAEVGPGSTVRLVAGSYRLDETVVLLQGVTLRGAGRDRTTLSSSAGSAAILVLTDGRVELDGLTLRHRGAKPASGLIGGPTSSVVLTDARVGGATGGRSDRGGGAGVLMSGRDGAEAGRGTTLETTGSEFIDNSGAGVLLTGRHRASIRDSRFVGNRQCGVCFTGRSSGAVRGSHFVGNAAGIAVLDQSRPLLQRLRFDDGTVGLQVGGRARPVVRDVVVDGPQRAAMIYADRAAGRIDRAVCRNVPFGIVVIGKRTFPYVGKGTCRVAQSG